MIGEYRYGRVSHHKPQKDISFDMNDDNLEFYAVIGEIITISGAVESKIDCIIART